MEIICTLLYLYVVAIFARIVLSWFPLNPDGAMATVGGALILITDPVLAPLRRVIPPLRMGTMALDLSPLVVLIGIQIIQAIICG